MAEKSGPFIYKPLKYHGTECTEIRLLALDPGTRDSEVCATLSHASFDQPPPYEALSYVWGNPILEEDETSAKANNYKKCRFIRLNRHSFAVGDNLYSALQYIRHEFESRVLWIDAVCIDQHNKHERGQQVRIMDQIYAKSSLVLAWLGESDEDSHAALNAVEDICWAVKIQLLNHCAVELGIPLGEVSNELMKNMEEPVFDEDDRAITGPFVGLYELEITELMACLESVDVHIPPDAQSVESIAANSSINMTLLRKKLLSNSPIDTDIPSLEMTFQSLKRFFDRRSYWHRLWIVQEIFHAPNVQLMCGSRCLNLDKIMIINQVSLSLDRRRDAPSAVMLRFAGQHFEEPLWRALRLLNVILLRINAGRNGERSWLSINTIDLTTCSCTEPVDRIFALLGISEAINITPDYEKPPAEIFIAATKAIIEQEQSLNILCFTVNVTRSHQAGRPPYHELPSFVPHFEAVLEYTNLINAQTPLQSPQQYYYCGGPFLSAYLLNTSILESEHSLAISGCFWGSIVCEWRAECVNKVIRWPQDWDDLRKYYADRFNNLGLAAERSSQNSTIRGWKTLLGDYYPLDLAAKHPVPKRMSKHNKAESLFMNDLYKALEHDSPSQEFLEQILYHMRDSSLYLTDRGDLVKASDIVRVGDEVFVARGLSCAMIVRHVSEVKAKEAAGEAARKNIQIREFIAGAYVDGIMDGEAIKKVDDGEIEEIQMLLV